MRAGDHSGGAVFDGGFDAWDEDAEAVVSSLGSAGGCGVGVPGVIHFVVAV